MNFATTRTAIENWITFILGSDISVYWKTRPRSLDTGRIICNIEGPISSGRDGVKWEYDSEASQGQEMTPVVLGNRTFTLQLRAETYASSNGEDAVFLTNLLLESMALPSVTDIFANASIGYRSLLSHTRLENAKFEREISTSILELSFHADTRTEGTAIGYVEQWGVESDIDGIPVAKQIDELMP